MNLAKASPAVRGGAKALLLTVLGEFVLPAGGQAWTSSLVAAAEALGLNEKNARQALARISDQGLLEGQRHGRAVRWELTDSGRKLLETGTQRIYEFGRRDATWNGQWLTAHCPVPESLRAVRNELRTELGFLGFGELSASLLISPHCELDPQLREVLGRLDLLEESTILWSKSINDRDDIQLVTKAWNLDELAQTYGAFSKKHLTAKEGARKEAFVALVELVHDWRRFPFVDPELPTQLLPKQWPGTTALDLFHQQHAALSRDAKSWYLAQEEQAPGVSD